MTDRELVRRNQKDKNSTPPQGKNYLLGIAINDYQQCTKLSNAVRDVEAFIELMCSRYNFEQENATFIKDAGATKKGIENAFLRLIKIITPEDNLIVYFSGHGRYDEHYGGNWVPVEAGINEEDWPDYLSNDSIKSYLGRIKSFHTFLVADSCFSGALFAERGKDKNLGNRVDTEPSRWALTSGKKEIVSDGEPGAHSPFASALLDVLRKAQEPLAVMQLCGLVLEKVAANAYQTPLGSALAVSGHQGGQLVLYLRDDEDEAWASAQTSATLAAYTTYCEKYPRGKYLQLALVKIDELEEQLEWDRVRKNRLADLLRYIADNPHSPFLAEAQRRIATLKAGEATPLASPPLPVIEILAPKIETPALIVPEHLVFVKGGTFEMGDVLGEGGSCEKPVHAVQIADFYLSRNLVTQAQWERIMGYNPSHFKDALLPIDSINWQEVQEFIRLLNKQSEMNYRLPSEAEWEYAARERGDKMRFGNGKNLALATEINFDSNKKDDTQFYVIKGGNWGKTTPISSFPPNSLGLYDMSGNLWEWCADVWHENYYNAPQDGSAWVLGGEQSMRVIRGGSWADEGVSCRTTFRLEKKFDGIYKDNFNVGFRLARHP